MGGILLLGTDVFHILKLEFFSTFFAKQKKTYKNFLGKTFCRDFDDFLYTKNRTEKISTNCNLKYNFKERLAIEKRCVSMYVFFLFYFCLFILCSVLFKWFSSGKTNCREYILRNGKKTEHLSSFFLLEGGNHHVFVFMYTVCVTQKPEKRNAFFFCMKKISFLCMRS